MTLRTAQALRVLTLLGAAVLLVGVLSKFVFAPEPKDEEVELSSDERGVADAIRRSTGAQMAVRGYVFEGPGGLALRLCDGRKPGDPPTCIGPFVELSGPGLGALALEDGSLDGRRVRWSDDPVTLLGPVDGAAMVVEQVLR